MNRKNKKYKYNVTWAHAVRDIIVTAINKGQLPPLGFIACVLLVLYRIPESSLVQLLVILGNKLKYGEYLSYPLLVASASGWIIHVKIIRKKYSIEYERIGREKSNLQSKLIGKDLKSSN